MIILCHLSQSGNCDLWIIYTSNMTNKVQLAKLTFHLNLEFSIHVMIKETFPLKYVGLNWYIKYKTNKSKSPQKVVSHVQDFKVSHFRWYDPQYLMPSWCGRILSIEKPKAHIIKYPSDRCHLRTNSTREKIDLTSSNKTRKLTLSKIK